VQARCLRDKRKNLSTFRVPEICVAKNF
jgi:hypothetical protein